MIDSLFIDGLKCHSNLNLTLSNLNLLVGTNSSGKSTVIQSLLLASHNVTSPQSSPLNGHVISIGNFKEARNYNTNAKQITFRMTSADEVFEIIIEEHPEREDGMFVITRASEPISKMINYNNHRLHFLSAHRIGSQDLYTKNYDAYDKFGIFGEYAIDHFQQKKTDPIADPNLIRDNVSITLETQVNYWLKRIINHELNTSEIAGTDKIKADFTTPSNRTVRPKNTGSGVSYLISIIVSCLSSNKGDIILIENPEIHLHPKAQSQLAEFFVFIANAGIQLIIETHSDHIFNGIRVQVFKEVISKEKIKFHFFDINEENSSTRHSYIGVTERGRIEHYEKNLFDQFDLDLNALIGL